MEDSSSPPYRALASLLLYLFRKQAGPKEMAPLPPVYKAASLTTWFFPPKRQTLRSGADRFIESDGLGSVLKEKLRSVMEIHAKPPCENEKERERERCSQRWSTKMVFEHGTFQMAAKAQGQCCMIPTSQRP